MSALSARVAALGFPDDAATQEAVDIVTALAKVATRGNGFLGGLLPESDVAAVIVTAAARLLANPGQLDEGVGPVWTRGGFVGWSLAELVVLNARRGTAA